MRKIGGVGEDYLISTNEESPSPASVGYFPSESFEVVSDTIPSSWVEVSSGVGVKSIPEAWVKPRFFEDFYGGDEGALYVFLKEMEKILQDDP
ncbi:hypothetical protein HF690_08040 [Oleiagrimonas citrea]|uniref:Uncharacterized protein n=1 Tax=Oleiagrimonas citrea TaxID=1665687 RepID=A0A846ZMZ8_9GAMM|nr:hypothetical protein [Oleiagrimonas citrea]NKZ38909.1 hypothetical protein [Oleiagrimonas citrea]